MKITIAGIGNAGTTIGADLAKKGHQVTLLKTSRRLHNDNYEFLAKNHEIHVKDIDCSYKVKIWNHISRMDRLCLSSRDIFQHVILCSM